MVKTGEDEMRTDKILFFPVTKKPEAWMTAAGEVPLAVIKIRSRARAVTGVCGAGCK